ncbi:uncharacterized protein LOC133525694 isoform X1 [Cydia pomonella]|uniref:uncharacterized protein LOC133525694 isoform X1 n=1 Tax=Cydia pomonella TaxID=82600 RepID=UPI002ADE19E8|nr:uncharacterized protein LOC133525694 isoform X1 [Cydia pomonella]
MSKLVFVCLMIGMASAATFRGKSPKKPAHLAHKQGCYVDEVKDVIPYGSMATPIGQCIRIECGGDMLYYATCGVVSTSDPKCHKTKGDLTKPYPHCCPTIKCDSENQV